MAHDSDIDSWKLRQAELPCQEFHRGDTRATRPHVQHEFQDRGNLNGSLLDEYSRLRTRTRCSRSDVRCNDPTKFTDHSLRGKQSGAPRSTVEANCGNTEALNGDLSLLSISESPNDHGRSGDHDNGRYTYRCRALASPTTPSTILSSNADSKSSVRVVSCTIGKPDDDHQSKDPIEQPEVQRYALNGTRVVECSASSTNLSDGGGSTRRLIQAKRRAYEEWVEKKRAEELRRKEELRRIELEKQAEEDRSTKEREDRERRERENFLRWTERKRKEEAMKREDIEKELEFERRLKQVEDKAVVAKTIYLRQWARKKEEQQKALQRRAELRKKRDDEERQRRLDESAKAYVKWRETSKNRPKPATQGLLPHQTAKPSYVNPNPWIGDNDDESQEPTTRKKQSSGEMRKIGTNEARSNKSLVSKQ